MNIPDISNLQNVKVLKEETKKDAYILVLKKCIEKIIYTNINTDQQYVIFEVPEFLIDYPFYNMRACIIYIVNQLQPKKYKVQFIEPNYLYIDWSTPDKPTVIKTNPIKTSNPSNLKKQTKELLKKYPNTTRIVYEYAEKN